MTSAGLQFRQGEQSDIEALASLINKAFLVERPFIDGDRTSPEVVRDLFKTGYFLLAEEDQNLIGCVYLEQRGDRAYLGLLSIEPGRQGAGLGTRLTLRAEEHARACGAALMELKVVSGRIGLPEFYRRLGYHVAGTEPFPADLRAKVPFHFLKMSKKL